MKLLELYFLHSLNPSLQQNLQFDEVPQNTYTCTYTNPFNSIESIICPNVDPVCQLLKLISNLKQNIAIELLY